MPRAHCLDCGDHVVVDPSGRCPEGHHVGIPGARIEGSLGTSHPDEPEPWVAKVVLDDELTATFPLPPRQARPLAAPPAPEQGAEVAGGTVADRPDDLLRELHSLGDLDGTSAPAASLPAVPAPPVVPPVAPAAAAPPAASYPSEEAEPWSAPVVPSAPSHVTSDRDAFEELSALEAAVQALSGANGSGYRASTNGNGLHGAGTGHASNGHATNGHANNGHVAANGNGHTTNGHVATNGNGHATNGHVAANGNGHTGLGGGSSLDDLFGPELAVGSRPADVSPAATDPAPWSAPVSEVPRSVTEQLDELFAAAERGPAPAPTPAPAPPRPLPPPAAAAPPSPPSPVPASRPTPAEPAAPARWSVLADVAELAESAPVPQAPPAAAAPAMPTAPPAAEVAHPEPPAPPADPGIDLGNFTARGKRVGGNGKGKRRLFGR